MQRAALSKVNRGAARESTKLRRSHHIFAPGSAHNHLKSESRRKSYRTESNCTYFAGIFSSNRAQHRD